MTPIFHLLFCTGGIVYFQKLTTGYFVHCSTVHYSATAYIYISILLYVFARLLSILWLD